MKTTTYSLCVILLLCITIRIPAQTSDKTYHLTRTYTQPGGTSYTEEIRYLDGFGRDKQIVMRSASPQGYDIISPISYGPFGITERTYLPYTRSGNNGAYYSNSLAAANWSAYSPTDQAYAYCLTEYDHSPLNRVVRQTAPGAAWHTAGKGVSTVYGHNTTGEVRLYRIASNGSLTLDGTYAAGRLSKTTVTDEDGNSVITYVDNRDQTLLTVNIDGIDRLETYFVYDDRGQLRRVLTPEASLQLGTGTDASVLDKYAYRYEYDRFGRMSEKQLPGCAPVYMVYDQKDRLVLSQDGNQRTTNQWTYTLYDTKNRPVETGTVTLSGKNHTQLQTEAENSDNYLPSAPITANQYIAYDNYAPTPHITAHPFTAAPGYDVTFHTLTTGLETSVKTRIIGTDTWLTATYYYDNRCRLIHTVSDNLFGYKSRTYSQYDFTGNLTKQRETHETSPGRTDIIEKSNTYDQQCRLLSSTASLNNGTPATINYTYDELGRLTGKRYGNLPEALSYNIRGWLTGKTSTPFRMNLRYNNPEGGSTPCYNGNLSEWEWQQGTNAALMYGFTYDALNRLTSSIEKQKSGTSWTTLATHSQEEGISYDRNGNLKTLKRKAHGTIVDNLTYTYTGNQLTTLTETAVVPLETAVVPLETDIYPRGTSAAGTYTYDANGNMLTDSRRTLNFEYNFLNLVNRVTSGSSLKATYTWLADGTKQKVVDATGNGFHYLGSLTYCQDNGGLQLETANFGDGVIRPTINGGQEIHYHLRDHLGSVRVIVDEIGTVREQNDYYPFGEHRIVAGSRVTPNRFKYNGKELQTTGELGFLDYGARMYDPELGRWFNTDPLAEKYYSLSSYNYCLNNPLKYIDPDGTSTWVMNNGNGTYRVVGGDIYDGSRNIYVINSMEDLLALFESGKTGTILGETLTPTSFYNSDALKDNENPWFGTIVPLDMSGIDFIKDFINNTPGLINYMQNAGNGEIYDFKQLGYTNLPEGSIKDVEYYYRGMFFGWDYKNAIAVYASARDVGNFAAGYIAGAKGMPWGLARLGFDGYQSMKYRGLSTEGVSTQNAQFLGYKLGILNFRNSIMKTITKIKK